MMRRYPGFVGGSGALPVRQWFTTALEFRPPRKGEFYISGAIPEVYRALNDLSTAYHIALPCATPPARIVVDGFVYRLEGAS